MISHDQIKYTSTSIRVLKKSILVIEYNKKSYRLKKIFQEIKLLHFLLILILFNLIIFYN